MRWAQYHYEKSGPSAKLPPIPDSLVCVNGIASGGLHFKSHMDSRIMRIDVRKDLPRLALAREGLHHRKTPPVLEDHWIRILREHLASTARAAGPEGWLYKQELMDQYPLADLWTDQPGTLRLFSRGSEELGSMSQLAAADRILTVSSYRDRGHRSQVNPEIACSHGPKHLHQIDIDRWSEFARQFIFAKRSPSASTFQGEGLCLEWAHSSDPKIVKPTTITRLFECALPSRGLVAVAVHRVGVDTETTIVANSDNVFWKWCKQLGPAGATITELVAGAAYGTSIAEISRYLAAWRKRPPDDLPSPPDEMLTEQSFHLRPDGVLEH